MTTTVVIVAHLVVALEVVSGDTREGAGKMKNIGGLWKGYGKVEFYGNINGQKFLVFRNAFKKTNAHPDYIIVESKEDGKEDEDRQN